MPSITFKTNMDNFINMAKEGIQQFQGQQGQQHQQEQQGDFNAQGGAQWNSPHQNTPGYQPSGDGSQGFQHGGGQRIGPDVDADEAVRSASQHAGNSGGNELFGQAMSFLHSNPDEHTRPVNEEHVQNAHDQVYNQGNAKNMDASSLGGAAAMQVLKKFTSGGGGGGGGNTQTQLISMAMGEAAKLFESSGGGGGNKQEAVNSAAMTVMKLVVQSKFSGGAMGGGNSGGLGGLMSMASKFM